VLCITGRSELELLLKSRGLNIFIVFDWKNEFYENSASNLVRILRCYRESFYAVFFFLKIAYNTVNTEKMKGTLVNY